MSDWHVWGDYVHTLPDTIGEARLSRGREREARASADADGFDFQRRLRNGFEPWAAVFSSAGADDAEQAFQFASYPIVRGWKKL